jgi:small GTP-binding protein
MNEDDVEKTFKLILIGDPHVGKTCILRRFIFQDFSITGTMTIGVEFNSKIIEVDGKIVNLNIWDTAGQEMYRAITNQYYRNASGVLIVYDVTSRKSFNNIKLWLKDLEKNCDMTNIVKLLIGNKVDMPREVSQEEAKSFAARSKMAYIETSALSNSNIEQAFEEITKVMLSTKSVLVGQQEKMSQLKGNPIKNSSVYLGSEKKKPKSNGGCCCGRDYSE